MKPLVYCYPDQKLWAENLGIPAFLNRDPNLFEVRPSRILHIASLAQKPDIGEIFVSVAKAGWEARSLRIPFVYVGKGGPIGVPSTTAGTLWRAVERIVQEFPEATIFRVNGLFGPWIDNEVFRWVHSEFQTVDSTRLVNPVHQSYFKAVLTEEPSRPGAHCVGSPAITWYDFFVAAGGKRVKPWPRETKTAKRTHEQMLDWPPAYLDMSYFGFSTESQLYYMKSWLAQTDAMQTS